MDNLRLEGSYASTPCKGVSRWRNLGAACAPATNLDAATRATLTTALRFTRSQNPGATVLDITPGATGCSAVNAIGSKLDIDGVCWQHVHPHTLNVYDFSTWALVHPGNAVAAANGKPNPITKPAEIDAGTTLRFPSFHAMTRWTANQNQLALVGTMGTSVNFLDLPMELKTPKMAAALGSKTSRDVDDVDACGSLGEGASDPKLGHHYSFFRPAGCGLEGGITQCVLHGMRTMPHNNLAIKAKDQLRQRMAWALSQIFMLASGVHM